MTTEPDPAVVALGRSVQRAIRRLDDLDNGLRSLADDVSKLTQSSASNAAAVRSWLDGTDPDTAIADLADLVAWVSRIYLHYPRAVLPSCWLWHPTAIEELWWLRCAHADAFHPENGSWLRVGDWHDRQRPGVANRLNASLSTCSLSRHRDRQGRPADVIEPAPAALAEHHVAIALTWTTDRAAGPTPTDEQITEADHYDNAQSRTHR